MADLITVETFAVRTKRDVFADPGDYDHIAALIADASALAIDIVGNPTVTDEWSSDDVPAAVVPVIVAMVRRGVDNPHGFTSERSFEYQYQGASDAGVFATQRESVALRRAAGRSTLTVVDLDGYMAAPDARFEDGGSWLEGSIT